MADVNGLSVEVADCNEDDSPTGKLEAELLAYRQPRSFAQRGPAGPSHGQGYDGSPSRAQAPSRVAGQRQGLSNREWS